MREYPEYVFDSAYVNAADYAVQADSSDVASWLVLIAFGAFLGWFACIANRSNTRE